MKPGQIVIAGQALGSEKKRPWLLAGIEGDRAAFVMLTSSCNKDQRPIMPEESGLAKPSYPAYGESKLVPVRLCSLFPLVGEVRREVLDILVEGAFISDETPDAVVRVLEESY